MTYINFSKANCRNCFKCLRSCPVKAIKIKNEQAEIVTEKCIACGVCLTVCPQNVRYIVSELSRVKEAIKDKKKLIASIAPSFPGGIDVDKAGQIVAALKHLGFKYVEETAVGADKVSNLYVDYLGKGKLDNVITTCCPAVNFLIQRNFPELIDYMIPVVSPMVAHGKIIREKYGMDSFVVFIGPCLAKKYEAREFQHDGIIDAVLTFEELNNWLKDEKINPKDFEEQDFDATASVEGKGYPVTGGVLDSIALGDKHYDRIVIHGVEECVELLSSMKRGDIEGICLEANACKGGCIGGPGFDKYGDGFYKRQRRVKDYIRNERKYISDSKIDSYDNICFDKAFFNQSQEKESFSEEDIKKVLNSMGKFTSSDEMNCGVCGYNTCRDKARAVLAGMAETNMCLDFMRNKAERMTNLIFENSPNIIIILDEELRIKEFNPEAERIFSTSAMEARGNPISIYMDDDDFNKVNSTKLNIYRKKVELEAYSRVVLQNILYIEKQNIFLAIMEDITHEEKNDQELTKVKENTINAAQQVIDKQMRVVQEIASLLGETTAETKVILTKLKKVAMGEVGDI